MICVLGKKAEVIVIISFPSQPGFDSSIFKFNMCSIVDIAEGGLRGFENLSYDTAQTSKQTTNTTGIDCISDNNRHKKLQA